MFSWEWRCSWSSAHRRCSNYIWVINIFIGYWSAIYITGLTVIGPTDARQSSIAVTVTFVSRLCIGHVVNTPTQKSKVVMLSSLSPLVAPEILIKTTHGVASDDKFGVMTTFGFQGPQAFEKFCNYSCQITFLWIRVSLHVVIHMIGTYTSNSMIARCVITIFMESLRMFL